MKFHCDCRAGILDIIYDKPTKKFPFPSISVLIYGIYSPKTGKKYKKPKLKADIILMNNAYPEEMNKFINFVKEIPLEVSDKRYIKCKYCERIKTPDEITTKGCVSCDVDYCRSLCKIKKEIKL